MTKGNEVAVKNKIIVKLHGLTPVASFHPNKVCPESSFP